MNKKDRIAIVFSILYCMFPLVVLIIGDSVAALIFIAPLVAYWGYRFVKNDISFLSNER